MDLYLLAFKYLHWSICTEPSLYVYMYMEVGGSTHALLAMTVFQQTASNWHGDSPHSELEGGPPGLQGPGASRLLGCRVLWGRPLAEPRRPQDLERSRHSYPQSPRNHQETVCWQQTGWDSSQRRYKCTRVQIFTQSAVIHSSCIPSTNWIYCNSLMLFGSEFSLRCSEQCPSESVKHSNVSFFFLWWWFFYLRLSY